MLLTTLDTNVVFTVEEEFDDSSLRDLHQACSAAHTSKAYVDKHVVSGWSGVSKKLKGLAEEVQQGAPADLFDTAAANQQPPSSDTQMQQLQQIVKVQLTCALHCPLAFCKTGCMIQHSRGSTHLLCCSKQDGRLCMPMPGIADRLLTTEEAVAQQLALLV